MKTVWEPFLRKFITRCRARGTPSESDAALCGQIARHALDTYTKFLAHYQDELAEPEVSAEARRTGAKAHVGRICEICVEKGSELPYGDPGRKFKGRVVFQGNEVL